MIADEPNPISNKVNSESMTHDQSSNFIEQTVQQSNSKNATNAGIVQHSHIGDNYNYQADSETIRQIVQQELNSPQIKYIRSVREGLNALADMAVIPEIRDAIVAFRTDFKAACDQISILASYKDLHDLLHRLEFECYKNIILDAKRFPDDEISLETLIEYGLTLQSIIHQLETIASREVLVTQEVLWIRELEQAHAEFQNALDEQNAHHLKQTIRLLSRVLAIHPSRINTHLNAAARALRLPSLGGAMEHILRHLNSSELSADKTAQFQQGFEALNQMQERLLALVIVHDSWQVVDVELRQLEVSLDHSTDNLKISWSYLKVRVSKLCDGNTDSWSIGFQKDGENLECVLTAAVQDINQIRRCFRLYRRRASERFYQIDIALKRLCDELRTIGEPLASVLRTVT